MHNLSALEESIRGIQTALAKLQEDDSLEEVLQLIHRPGWTTPAEHFLVQGLTEILADQVTALAETREFLLDAARKVGESEIAAPR